MTVHEKIQGLNRLRLTLGGGILPDTPNQPKHGVLYVWVPELQCYWTPGRNPRTLQWEQFS